LAAYDLKMTYPQTDINLYNYGSPRVGNKAFVTTFKTMMDGKDFRVVHADDPVPHIPFDFTTDGYHHIQ
jgi:predicted lipase